MVATMEMRKPVRVDATTESLFFQRVYDLVLILEENIPRTQCPMRCHREIGPDLNVDQCDHPSSGEARPACTGQCQ
ncbi:hypothetical protein T01_271 [Trichinella spiralis]|uniref:Uncharacterized protein n=1 Tax=Trichinella spiralis TaxID=6334 RepID=A0A0V1BTG6_TRISP|nr:hypothetical protein T01_271 [Trichinella spiralis]